MEAPTIDSILSKKDFTTFEELKKTMKTNIVVGICGAGLSVPLGYPTWNKLMELMLKFVKDNTRDLSEKEFGELLLSIKAQQTSLPYIASLLKKKIDETNYYAFLKMVFHSRCKIDLSYEYECLAALPVRIWITTNYDSCLSNALNNCLKQNIIPISDFPYNELGNSNDTLPKIVHLHGIISDPQKIILTSSDYTKYEINQQLGRTFSGFPATTLLFVGYGLGDDEINRCLKTMKAVFGMNIANHYALLPKYPKQTETEIKLKEDELIDKGIKTIFYNPIDQKHTGRLELIKNIVTDLGRKLPEPKEELTIHWNNDITKISDFRDVLTDLEQKARISGPLILCGFSEKEKAATVTSMIPEDVDLIKKALKSNNILTLIDLNINSEKSFTTDNISEKTEIHISSEIGPLKISKEILNSTSVINNEDFKELTSKGNQSSDVKQSEIDDYHGSVHAISLDKKEPYEKEILSILNPLMPPKLKFGISDCFHPYIDWRLDSPIIHSWIYTDSNSKAVAITIVGTGLNFIYEAIEKILYTSLITIPDELGGAIIQRGFIQFSSMGSRESKVVNSNFINKIGKAIFPRNRFTGAVPAGVQDVIENIHSLLKKLSKETGFIYLHETKYESLVNYRNEVREFIKSINNDEKVNFLPPKNNDRVVTSLPYPYYSSKKNEGKKNIEDRIYLNLSADLIKTPVFKELIEIYYQNIVFKLISDLKRRIEFYKDELARMEEEVKWYHDLTQEEKNKIPPIVTDHIIDKELAISVAIEKSSVPAAVYYPNNLEKCQIPETKKEIEKLEADLKPLSVLFNTEDKHPLIWLKCLSKIFDCAIRQVSISEDSKINNLFQRWSDQVNPMLRFEWERLLQRFNINKELIFRRNTFFDIKYNKDENVIKVFPNAIIDSFRTTIVCDKNKHTLRVEDIIDYANNLKPENDKDDITVKKEIETVLALKDKEVSKQKLKELVFNHPSVIKNVIKNIFKEPQDLYNYETLRNVVLKKAKNSSAALRFIRFLNESAFNSAIECLEPIEEWDEFPSKALVVAVFKCYRLGINPLQTLKELRHNPNISVHDEIREPFLKALKINEKLVDNYLNHSIFNLDHIDLTDIEKIIFDMEHSLEAAKMAECLTTASFKLNTHGETLNKAFFKTEEYFETVYSSLFENPTNSLSRILDVLNQKPIKL